MWPSNWPIVISGKHVSGQESKIKKAELKSSALEAYIGSLSVRTTTHS